MNLLNIVIDFQRNKSRSLNLGTNI